MKRHPLAWLSVFLTMALTLAAAGANDSSRPGNSVRVGLYENEPKVYTDADGRPAGLFVDLITEMAAREGWSLDFRACHWSQCLTWLNRGDIDLMPDVSPSGDRPEHLAFNRVPIFIAWSQLYGQPIYQALDFDDLAGRRVAVLEGSAQHRFLIDLLDEKDLDLELVRTDSMLATLQAVQDLRADFAATNNFFGGRMASRYGLLETPISFGHTNLHFATVRNGPVELLDRIDHHLAIWKNDIESPYFKAIAGTLQPAVSTRLPSWVYPTILITVAIAVLASLAVYLLRGRLRIQVRQRVRSDQRLEHLLASAPVILYSLRGEDMQVEWVSGNTERILGFTKQQTSAPDWWSEHLQPEDRSYALRNARRIFEDKHSISEYRIRDARGKTRYVRDERRLLTDPEQPGVPVIIGSWTDLTEEHERHQQLHHLANRDAVTGLPNRNLLIDRLGQAILRARRLHRSVRLVLVDLDRFRNINDSLGSVAGDKVLIEVAQRLQSICVNEATVARVGSDEFALILEEHSALTDPETLIMEIRADLAIPIDANGQPLVVSASIGLADYPDHGRHAEAVLTAAELAVEAARRAGGDRVQAYEPSLAERTSRRLLLETELRRAIEAKHFELHYQPQVILADGSLHAYEALVRWRHPERGLIPPADFIPLAEETGLIERIDQWVLEEACRQLARWDADGHESIRIAVNLSSREFQAGTLVDRIQSALTRHGLGGNRLEVEITETMLMEFPEQALDVLHRLEEIGVHLCMDDFGSGYSNLAFIHRLPLHQLKIDRSFTHDIGHSRHNRLIIQAIIAMAHALELELVAEGIENDSQLTFLRDSGCHIGQGFLLGRPITADEIVNPLTVTFPEASQSQRQEPR